MKNLITIQLILLLSVCASLTQAQTLKGSAASIDKQYRAARSYGYTFIQTAQSVSSNLSANQLVRVHPDRYMELHDVSYPYAVPETKLFLSRLSAQYYSNCGEKMTVTSLLRPRDRQPANAVAHSVHPTGMAADLRIPPTQTCRTWLENALLSREREGVIDVTREHYPPHYHVAVFARNYETRVATLSGPDEDVGAVKDLPVSQAPARPVVASVTRSGTASSGAYQKYVVRKGDTLSEIASRTGVHVASLRSFNNVRGNLINAGQQLRIPSKANGTSAAAAGRRTVVAANEITHRVNRGDTLWRIANRYGISVEHIRRENRQAGEFLQVGQVLKFSKG